MNEDTERYEDIIRLPHPTSRKHKRMPLIGRAAQFAPFAALNGYEEAVDETARLTDPCAERDEEMQKRLDEALHRLMEKIGEQPEIAITCFVPDEKKAGGSYTCITGRVRRIDEISREIILTDRTAIPMDRIYGIAIVEEK